MQEGVFLNLMLGQNLDQGVLMGKLGNLEYLIFFNAFLMALKKN